MPASFFITPVTSNRSSENGTNASGRSSSTSANIRKLMATATRNNSGTAAVASSNDTSKAQTTFHSSFATVSTANSSLASLDASSSTSFVDEASHSGTTTRRVSYQTVFFADSSSSLGLDDIAEANANASAGHSRPPHHTKEDLQAGSSSLPLVNETEASEAEEDTLGEEQRQTKRHAAFLLKPRKKELHYFVFAAEIEAELDDYDSDDDFDEDQASSRQS